jgi:hypothetical protein
MSEDDAHSFTGDLEERFHLVSGKNGVLRATFEFWRELLCSVPSVALAIFRQGTPTPSPLSSVDLNLRTADATPPFTELESKVMWSTYGGSYIQTLEVARSLGIDVGELVTIRGRAIEKCMDRGIPLINFSKV